MKNLNETQKKQKSRSLTSRNNEVFKCEKCRDREFLLVINEDGYEVAKECECRKVRQHERRIKNSKISKTFQNKNFSNFEEITENHKKLKDCVIDFFKKKEIEEHSILFLGQVGSGKTHLAMALTNNLLKQGKNVLYIDYRSFISKLKQNMLDKEEYKKMLTEAKEVEILFIDDFFKGKITESDLNIIFELINFRYLANLQMIITTEKTLEELQDIDEAITSRIIEMTGGYVINMPKINFRFKQINER